MILFCVFFVATHGFELLGVSFLHVLSAPKIFSIYKNVGHALGNCLVEIMTNLFDF